MSRGNKQFGQQLVTLARQSGGSFKTVADRSRIAARLAEQMLKLNIQIRDVNHIKTHHIEHYVRSRLAEDISKRTLQNEMAALRAILTTAGRTKLADPKHEKLSNDALNLSGASRAGSKTAITDERFHEALALVRIKDEGVALAMEIARYLGLRTEEAVQSAKSLKTWQQALARGDERLRVVFGTKGGRPRYTTVVRHDELVRSLNAAMSYASENGGKLVDKAGLKSAIDRYRNVAKDAGLTGKEAPHSLRYAYSREATEWHMKNGLSRREAEAMVSMDLGHGDGRGSYVRSVYAI
ncbi:TPA: integrase domain-containing protein [Klebsiella michiganensis]|nr:integrase domain-containing protein [Klebsiella michiganensis]ELS4625815.1 integrase domain-containing protein [Klebsiella michiganensis]HCU0766827.1 integrase domain-containing protein [Klebsiella michiganensis]HEP0440739.1 integrase domain-containing protein [Klebsiella michiganensis]HEP0466820.1 integrase domain-containing protein [Klebsiella michiganensis]